MLICPNAVGSPLTVQINTVICRSGIIITQRSSQNTYAFTHNSRKAKAVEFYFLLRSFPPNEQIFCKKHKQKLTSLPVDATWDWTWAPRVVPVATVTTGTRSPDFRASDTVLRSGRVHDVRQTKSDEKFDFSRKSSSPGAVYYSSPKFMPKQSPTAYNDGWTLEKKRKWRKSLVFKQKMNW